MRAVLGRIADKLVRTHTFMVFAAPCRDAAFPLAGPGEQLCVLRQGNLADNAAVCAALVALNPSNAEYIADIRRGWIIGFVIVRGGTVVHASYLFLKNKTACILGLRPDTALMGNAFTVPAYRGQGCQPRSVAARAALAREAGFERVAAETSPDNVASQRGLQKAGMRLTGRLDLVVLLNVLVIRWRRPPGVALLGLCLRA